MKNLINFFFSFDKLMKEKLVIAFFWLAVIVFGLEFFSAFLSGIKLGPLAWIVDKINFIGSFLLGIVAIRLLCEIAVAIFRINNNLSPDGGKSETADIDPIIEARKAAEAAAQKAREVSKSAVNKTSSVAKTTVDDVTDSAKTKVSKATHSAKTVTRNASRKTKAVKDDITIGPASKTAKPKNTPKKKVNPKPTTKKSSPTINKDGVRLKKDGTPAKKPGPKKS